MYERFTDRARKVMAFANSEALRFNHEYLGTEHLLLGLLKEGSGIGATVLKDYEIDLLKARTEVEKFVKTGPDMGTMGKLPQTPRAKKVIEYAIDFARKSNHNYVGTEHILYGIMEEQEGIGAQVLMNLSPDMCSLENLEKKIMELLGEKDVSSQPTQPAEEYWNIPRKSMDLYEFLQYNGFKVQDRNKLEDNSILLISPSDESLANLTIGQLRKTSSEPLQHNEVTIEYYVAEKQIEEVLKLRGLLEENNYPYQEKPPREEIIKGLRKQAENTNSLIDRLEGKVKPQPIIIKEINL